MSELYFFALGFLVGAVALWIVTQIAYRLGIIKYVGIEKERAGK